MSHKAAEFVKRFVYFANGYGKTTSRNCGKIVQCFGFLLVGTGSFVYLSMKYGLTTTLLASDERKRKKIVVLGTGWAAVNFLKNLKPDLYEIEIVSPRNYFLMTPLLPSVTVGRLEARSLVEPIRKIYSKKHKMGIRFHEAKCVDVDVEKQQIKCRDVSGSFYNVV